MQLEIKLNSFEGPLDLLLHLIDKNKINIYDIPIVEITKQYIEYIDRSQEDDLDLMSDFLVMAATLIQIKVNLLLPPEVDELGEEVDPRQELTERLLEYRLYKQAAELLREQETQNQGVVYRAPAIPQEVQQYEPPMDIDAILGNLCEQQLRDCYKDLLRRSAGRVDPIRSQFGNIVREKLRVSDKMVNIMDYAKNRPIFTFGQIVSADHSKVNIVVTFLACLELIKIGCLHCSQEEEFGEIYFEWDERAAGQIRREELALYDRGL